MTPFRKGFATALGVMATGAATVTAAVLVNGNHLRLSDEALSDMAQIGATLLVAYALEMSWFVKESRARGGRRENWLGFVTGIGTSSACGIAICIGFVGHQGDAGFLGSIGAMWAIFSLGFLGLFVAALPYLLYDLAHSLRTEYPSE